MKKGASPLEIRHLDAVVSVEEHGGILNWNYKGMQWQTGPRQKKLSPSYFTRHVPVEQRIPLELREEMVNYHKKFYQL